MAKKEKKSKKIRPPVVIVRKSRDDAQHVSFAAQGATFAWKLAKWSMLLNLVLVAIACAGLVYGIMKPHIYVAASSNINLTRLLPL